MSTSPDFLNEREALTRSILIYYPPPLKMKDIIIILLPTFYIQGLNERLPVQVQGLKLKITGTCQVESGEIMSAIDGGS